MPQVGSGHRPVRSAVLDALRAADGRVGNLGIDHGLHGGVCAWRVGAVEAASLSPTVAPGGPSRITAQAGAGRDHQTLARAIKALGDLIFECACATGQKAPSNEMYDRAFHELRAIRRECAQGAERALAQDLNR